MSAVEPQRYRLARYGWGEVAAVFVFNVLVELAFTLAVWNTPWLTITFALFGMLGAGAYAHHMASGTTLEIDTRARTVRLIGDERRTLAFSELSHADSEDLRSSRFKDLVLVARDGRRFPVTAQEWRATLAMNAVNASLAGTYAGRSRRADET